MTLPITAALLGLAIAGSILFLVRRGHLHGAQAMWWLAAAMLALLVGVVPRSVDLLGKLFGVAYPPMLVAVLAIIVMLIKQLQADIALAHKERRLRRLTQKMALLEDELRRLGGRTSEQADLAEPVEQPDADAAEREAGAAGRALHGKPLPRERVRR